MTQQSGRVIPREYGSTCAYLHGNLVLLHGATQPAHMLLPSVLAFQQAHTALQLLNGLLQLEALPGNFVQYLHVRN